MKHEVELKLQAWMDGQLPVHEAGAVARLIEDDAAARALLAELKHTRAALAGFEAEIKLPESREFYWSKIARAIERPSPKPAPANDSWLQHFRRRLVSVGAVGALLLLGLFASRPGPSANLPYDLSELVADSDAFTFTDEESGTTLIWFSYPGENEFAAPDDSHIL